MATGQTSKLDYLTHHEAGHAAVAFSLGHFPRPCARYPDQSPISWPLPQLCGFGECLDPLLGDGVVNSMYAASPDEQHPIEHPD